MTDATSIVPTQVLSGVLSDPTAMLFGLEEFSVLRVDRCGPRAVKVIIEQIARDGPCPDCGVLSAVVKDRPLTRIKDLPASGQAVELWWRKRRFRCVEDRCPRRAFTQTATAVRPRSRLTERLRDKLASAIAGSNRSVADVAAEYGCHGRPRTRPWSWLRPTGYPSPSPRRCWGSTRPGSDRSVGFLTGSPGDVRIRG
jgi:transposase